MPACRFSRSNAIVHTCDPLGSDCASELSDKRQRAAIAAFAKANGYVIVEEFYDVVSGADPIAERPGFKAMLDRIAGNGVRVILVVSS